MLGKLVNGALSYAPKKIVIDGKTIFNPPESLLKEQGYKDVETTEAPTVTTMTQQPVSTWTDQEDKIVQSWEIKLAQPDPSAALQEFQTQAILEQIKASDDKTLGIQCMALFPVYEQNKQHEVGEVATHPETGYPYECMTAYDGAVQQGWTIDNRTLWKPWHSRKKEYALPWEQPTGAHDMYKSGEYMIWTDGNTYKCKQDTNFSPEDYPQAWEKVSEIGTEEPTEPSDEKAPDYVEGKWYYRGDKVTYNGKEYECIAPEGQVCVWSPEAYPTYWQEVSSGTEQGEE